MDQACMAAGNGQAGFDAMCKLLIVFESDGLARPPGLIRAVAGSARTEGTEVRLRALPDVRLRDVDWADRLALAIRARGEDVPPAVKAWVDGLGFSGWRVFRDKPGCVIPITGPDLAHPDAPPVCRAVANFLAARGMSPVTAGHAGILTAERRTGNTEPRRSLSAAH